MQGKSFESQRIGMQIESQQIGERNKPQQIWKAINPANQPKMIILIWAANQWGTMIILNKSANQPDLLILLWAANWRGITIILKNLENQPKTIVLIWAENQGGITIILIVIITEPTYQPEMIILLWAAKRDHCNYNHTSNDNKFHGRHNNNDSPINRPSEVLVKSSHIPNSNTSSSNNIYDWPYQSAYICIY